MKRIRTFSRDVDLVNERRREIVKGTTTLFMQKGYHHTNTRQIAQWLGKSKGSIYHYFGSKIDILILVFKFALDDQERLVDKMENLTKEMSGEEALRKSIKLYLENVDHLQDMYNFINNTIVEVAKSERQIVYRSEQKMIGYFENLLAKGEKSGGFKISERLFLAHTIVMMCNAWANRRWFLRKMYTIEKYTEELITLVLNSVANSEAKRVGG